MSKQLHILYTITLTAVLLVSAGCAVTPPSPPDDTPAVAMTAAAMESATVAAAAVTPAPAAPSPAPVPVPEVLVPTAPAAPVIAAAPNNESPKPAKPIIKAPAKPLASPSPTPKPQSAAPAPAPAPLAIDTLEQRLKDTPAIGVFTKLTLKNQVDDLLNRFRAHYEGRGGMTIPQLRQSYEQLLAKVHGLLKDGDPGLAGAIINSREAIWSVLTDPVKFAKL